MKLWLDEARPAPDQSWTVCRTVREAQWAVWNAERRGEQLTECSLDHDLSGLAVWELGPSGLTFVKFLLLHYYHHLKKPKVEVHSQNPVGGGRMVYALWRAGYKVRWRPYGGFFGFIPFDRTLG